MRTATCFLFLALAVAVVCVASEEDNEWDSSVLRALLQDEIDMPAEAPAAATALTDAPAEPTEVVEPDAGVAQGPATAAVAQGPATATAAQALGPDAEVEDDLEDLKSSGTHGQASLFLLFVSFIAALCSFV